MKNDPRLGERGPENVGGPELRTSISDATARVQRTDQSFSASNDDWPPAAPDTAEPDNLGLRLETDVPLSAEAEMGEPERHLDEGIASCLRIIAAAAPDNVHAVFRNQTRAALEISRHGFSEYSIYDMLTEAGSARGLDPDFIQHTLVHGGVSPREPALSIGPERGTLVPEKKPSVVARQFELRDPTAIPRREWLYDRRLIRKFVSVTVAPGGAGKTTLSIVEALAMVTGRDLLHTGRKPDHPLKVWLWNLEDPLEEIERRIAAACIHYGIDAQQIAGRLFVNSGREQRCVIAIASKTGVVIVEPLVRNIISEINRHAVDVLTIDPFVSSHEVSENDNGAIDRVVKQWGSIANDCNCAIDLYHHVRKQGDGEVTVQSARGGSALVDAARNVRVLNGMSEQEGEKAGVETHRRYFRLMSGKQNLAPPAVKSEWFHLASVDLRNGPEGLSDLVQVVECWEWPNALSTVSVADLLSVQHLVGKGEYRLDARAANWVGKAIAEVLKKDITKKSDCSSVRSLLATWIATGALRVEKRRDDNRRERSFVVVGELAT